MTKKIVLSLLSALLLSLPWMGVSGLPLLVALVPLFFAADGGKKRAWMYVLTTVVVWNVLSLWWIAGATWLGVVAAAAICSVFVLMVFWVSAYVRRRASAALGWTVFIALWITYEYFYLNSEVSFPWLNLGFGFADDVRLVQWYEYSGSLGGTLWVLLSNVLIYIGLRRARFRFSASRIRTYMPAVACIIVPMIVSLAIYGKYKERVDPMIVTVVQPNIDPYDEKFDGMSQQQQTDILLNLASEAPADVDYIITPETSLDDSFVLNDVANNQTISGLCGFMRRYPSAQMILGATTYKIFGADESVTATARNLDGGGYYDAYNSALAIDSAGVVGVYHKSKLVTGVETLPYPQYLKWLSDMSLDLGGISGSLGSQADRTVFVSAAGRSVGVAICYESIYGEYFADYVRAGAEVMFVITNDGWWGDTPGYKQHFAYSRLRAIECRRAIARSANTGISGYINQRGDVIGTLGWDVRGAVTEAINLNRELTVYVRNGDMVGRVAAYVLALSLLFFVAQIFKNKLNNK